jgi:hypothetical protein
MRFLGVAPCGVGGSAARSGFAPGGRGRGRRDRGAVTSVEGLEGRVLFATVDVTLASNSLIIDNQQLQYLPTLRVFNADALVKLSGDNLQVSTTAKGDQMVTGQVSSIDDIDITSSAGGQPGLLFRQPAGVPPFTIQGIHTTLTLGKVDLGNARLIGTMEIGGASTVNVEEMNALLAQLGGDKAPVVRVSGPIVDSQLTFNSPVKSFSAGSFTSTTPGASLLSAPSFNLIRVPGSFSPDLTTTGQGVSVGKLFTGDIMGGKWTMTGGLSYLNAHSIANGRFAVVGDINRFNVLQGITNTTLNVPAINTLKVGGDIDGSVFSLHKMYDPHAWNLNRATVGGQVKDTILFSDGNINSFTADALNTSEFYCGVKPEVTDLLPADPANAFGQEVLFNVLKLKGKNRSAMAQSVLVCAHFAKLDLGTIQIPGASGTVQGIATKSILRLIMLLNGKKLTLKNLLKIPNLQQELDDAGLTLDSLKDFKINLPQ